MLNAFNKKNIAIMGLSSFIFAPQLQYFFPGVAKFLYVITFASFFIVFNPNLLAKKNIPFFVIFGALTILYFVMYVIGVPGDLEFRPLFIYSLIFIASLVISQKIIKMEGGSLYIANILILFILVEIVVVFLQFSYLSLGFGLQPEVTELNLAGFITGSFGNPNNVATILSLSYLVLVVNRRIQGNAFGIMFSFIIGVAIFFTLSRAATVVFSLTMIYFLFANKIFFNGYKFITASIFLLLPISILYYFADMNLDSEVLKRSMAKIFSILDAESDESIDFRFTSHLRLFENIGNLGYGSFSDLNYGIYFRGSDEWLHKVNPHSFLVELSFLFGYFGLILAICFFWVIYKNLRSVYGVLISIYLFSFIFVLQSVPSSLLALPLFFYLVFLVTEVDKNI
jgi:hypothetical protein